MAAATKTELTAAQKAAVELNKEIATTRKILAFWSAMLVAFILLIISRAPLSAIQMTSGTAEMNDFSYGWTVIMGLIASVLAYIVVYLRCVYLELLSKK